MIKEEKRKEVCREWNKRNPEKLIEKQKRHMRKYPEKIKARNISQKIKAEDKCSMCGAFDRLENHHNDYSKPEEIVTLCIGCHRRLHNDK